MQGRDGHFEGEAGQGHDQRGITNWLCRLRVEFFDNRGELEIAGQTIEQTDAKKGEGRGHDAKKKIFQARLRRRRAGFVKGRQHVEREAEHFQRDEDHQEVCGADQKHQSGGGDEKEGKILAEVPREPGAEGEDSDDDGQGEDDEF